MPRVVLPLLLAGLCVALVQTLRCYECRFGVASLCVTSQKTCQSGELCFSGVGEAAGFLPITLKGCLKPDKCNKTSQESFPSISNATLYSMTKTCCSTDLCNAAPGLPGAPGLSLILASISAVFMANLVA